MPKASPVPTENWENSEDIFGMLFHLIPRVKFAAYEKFYFCRIPLVDEHCVLLGYCAYTGMMTFSIIPCTLKVM